jgi:uncharacterized membrane protein YcfT
VDYAKGICMIGVVTLYAVNKLKMTPLGGGWLEAWADFAQPFRMPDFFLLSGLFLGRVLDRPWRDYLDKKVGHFAYFFLLWTSIFYAARIAALQVGLFRGEEDAGSLLHKLVEPFAMLWFIQLLPILFVVVRLLKRVPAWILLPLGAALQMWPVEGVHPRLITHFCERFIYFYVGYRFASHFFELAAWAEARPRLAFAALLTWAVGNGLLVHLGLASQRGISLALGLLGAMGVITAGSLLMRARGMAWLRYLGQKSLVIYLGFYLPMLVCLALTRRAGAWLDPGTLGFLASALSILAALGLYRVTRGTVLHGLFGRPAWTRFGGTPAATATPLLEGQAERA